MPAADEGDQSCEGSKWAKVHYTKAQGGSGSYISYSPPIRVTLEKTGKPGIKDFSGGQCNCVIYDFEYKIVYNEYYLDGFTGNWIQGFETKTFQSRSFYYGGLIPDIVEVSQGRKDWRINTSCDSLSGAYRSLLITGNADGTTRDGFNYSQKAENIEFSIFNVVRRDGQNDNCGDLQKSCTMKIYEFKGDGNTGSFVKVPFEVKGIGSACPDYNIECEGNCPPGTHREKSGACCCDNSSDLMRLTKDIRDEIKRF